MFVRNLVFYTHRSQVDLPTLESVEEFVRNGGRLIVIASEDVEQLASADAGRVEILGEVTYFNVANAKGRTILSPDPARDLERVVLLSRR